MRYAFIGRTTRERQAECNGFGFDYNPRNERCTRKCNTRIGQLRDTHSFTCYTDAYSCSKANMDYREKTKRCNAKCKGGKVRVERLDGRSACVNTEETCRALNKYLKNGRCVKKNPAEVARVVVGAPVQPNSINGARVGPRPRPRPIPIQGPIRNPNPNPNPNPNRVPIQNANANPVPIRNANANPILRIEEEEEIILPAPNNGISSLAIPQIAVPARVREQEPIMVNRNESGIQKPFYLPANNKYELASESESKKVLEFLSATHQSGVKVKNSLLDYYSDIIYLAAYRVLDKKYNQHVCGAYDSDGTPFILKSFGDHLKEQKKHFQDSIERILRAADETKFLDVVYIPLTVRFQTDGLSVKDSHSNVLIYRKRNHTIEHYEPNGTIDASVSRSSSRLYEFIRSTVDAVNAKDVLAYKVTYVNPSEWCPNDQGFQRIQLRFRAMLENGRQRRRMYGFCAIWCIFFAELCILNPHMTNSEIMKAAQKFVKSEVRLIKSVSSATSDSGDLKVSEYMHDVIRGYLHVMYKAISELLKSSRKYTLEGMLRYTRKKARRKNPEYRRYHGVYKDNPEHKSSTELSSINSAERDLYSWRNGTFVEDLQSM